MARADRDERVRRLTLRAQERSADSLAAVRRAIPSLRARALPVTVTAVAREAGVSVSYVSGNQTLRDEIRAASEGAPRSNRGQPDRASDASLRTQLTVAAKRLREQGDELNRLRQENAALRGELLELRRQERRRVR
jgi:DNA anti-recombination protein RmuC